MMIVMRLNDLGALVSKLVLAGAIGVGAQNAMAQGDPQYGKISEDNLQPSFVNTNTYEWNYRVTNSSASSINSIMFTNFYSIATNVLNSPASTWKVESAQNVGNNLWNFRVSVKNLGVDEIAAGSFKDFRIRTTYDPTNSVIQYGQRDGAILRSGDPFWRMPDVTNNIGPTGVAYKVNVSAVGDGNVTPTGQINVPMGSSTNLLATAGANCRLSSIVSNNVVVYTNSAGNNQITSTNFTYGPVNGAGNVQFSFVPQTFTLQVASQYGNPTPGTTNNIPYGTIVPQAVEALVVNPTNSAIRYRNTGPNIINQ